MGRAPIAALTALVLLALAGCGTSGKTTSSATSATQGPSISKATFVAKANAICTKGNAENKAAGAKLGANPSEVQVVAFVKGHEVPAIQAQLDAIKALGSPPGDEAKVAKMLALGQAGVDAVKSEPTLVTTGADVFAHFAQLAHPYGLVACAPSS
jgi:hypothetical protein